MNPKVTVIDAVSGQVTEREMTEEEIAEHEKNTANSVVIDVPAID